MSYNNTRRFLQTGDQYAGGTADPRFVGLSAAIAGGAADAVLHEVKAWYYGGLWWAQIDFKISGQALFPAMYVTLDRDVIKWWQNEDILGMELPASPWGKRLNLVHYDCATGIEHVVGYVFSKQPVHEPRGIAVPTTKSIKKTKVARIATVRHGV